VIAFNHTLDGHDMSREITRCLFAAVSLFLIGCSGGQETKDHSGQLNDPEVELRGVIRALDEALRQDRWESFKSLHVSRTDNEALKAAYRYANAAYRFRAAVIAAYGSEGWSKLQDPDAEQRVVLELPPDDDDWAASVPIKINGDTAQMENPWSNSTEYFVLENGDWKRDLFHRISTEEGLRSVATFLNRFAEAIEFGERNADPKQMSLEELRKGVAQRMLGQE
jgi:hypothetical protein